MSDFPALAETLLQQARTAGADDAEVRLTESHQFSTRVRQGAIETLTQATSRSIALRVFVEGRVARARASDLRPATLSELVKDAVVRARLANRDPCAGLPEEFSAIVPAETLELYDPAMEELDAEQEIALARETERIGLHLDPRVNNSGGASFHAGRGAVWLANSRGFQGHYRGTGCTLSLYLLGQDGSASEQVSDVWFCATRRRERLESAEQVARTTVDRVRRYFGARKVETQEVPVVFEPLLAAELLSDLFGAVTGEAVYQGQSFLADSLGQAVAAPGVTLVDDGLIPGGLGSQPFDAEGVACQRTPVVEAGTLRNFLCGSYSARKLGCRTTGNGTGNGEAPTNFYLAAGPHAPEAILGSVEHGLYATRLLGQGVNLVTGDYSRGVFGVWIEKGQLVYPVHEITISGNLRGILEGMEMVGRDLEFHDQFAAPTVKIRSMVVGGR